MKNKYSVGLNLILATSLFLGACVPQNTQNTPVQNLTVQTEKIQTSNFLLKPTSISKGSVDSTELPVPSFKTQAFASSPSLLNGTAGSAASSPYWLFRGYFLLGSTTVIKATLNRTLTCQSEFLPSTIYIYDTGETSNPFSAGFGYVPDLQGYDGQYIINMQDEVGNQYTYNVLLNNGRPAPATCGPITASPSPSPTPSPSPSSGGGGGNSGGGGNGGGTPSPTPTPPIWNPEEVCKSKVCDNFKREDINALLNSVNELARKYEQLTGNSEPLNKLSLLNEGFNIKANSSDRILLDGIIEALEEMRDSVQKNLELANEKIAALTVEVNQLEQDIAALNVRLEKIKKAPPSQISSNTKGELISSLLQEKRPLDLDYSQKAGKLDTLVSEATSFEGMLEIAGDNETLAQTIINCIIGDCYPENGSGKGVNNPDAPGCFRKLTGSQPIDLIGKDGNIIRSYTTAQGRSYEGHGVNAQPDPAIFYQDEKVMGELNASCYKPDVNIYQTRTNIDWMRAGYAPCDASGLSDKRDKGLTVQIHHFNQDPNGPFIEISTVIHQQVSHPNNVSTIHHDSFNRLTSKYWRLRAKQLTEGESSVSCSP
ncbi:hypothetical protein COW36_24165 [bacterium (Candidatus Blackallbacteria) CG17_big_fil_post_rev_8_21_14_2_50_48_46]|uniref:LHH domain-containing protein n=1 Tax=bacterium (Candidatus Blackallbacteria) CG17_big_fil_post_rev_8_21_14_2_50_48_46 TaxID=2014261 RepID=A0A2M7FYC4_9BACT|nr:MAG: hypothetical protein COW64_19105 [bacterium (Candidatus Blackallbacteria) CG18_big_fil_WC_8_21_14_2_50_49_26]PIW13766.1 MAG: hypothetical protein COW36_24165 [bacterium (Candidatus Blackallbacteria) CG17_big_fil_post_rev_8_21_14_2_50_48_46]PIW44992.1 MAG: hypothetical protein COW20_21795 [bacterium (Candidatus Blackallbacteria) CG13_big_fil_rev_8_21_14_2_50_49_14]